MYCELHPCRLFIIVYTCLFIRCNVTATADDLNLSPFKFPVLLFCHWTTLQYECLDKLKDCLSSPFLLILSELDDQGFRSYDS